MTYRAQYCEAGKYFSLRHSVFKQRSILFDIFFGEIIYFGSGPSIPLPFSFSKLASI